MNPTTTIGITEQFKTKDLRIIWRVYPEDIDTPKSKFAFQIISYYKDSTYDRTILECWGYTTFDECRNDMVMYVNDNFKLLD